MINEVFTSTVISDGVIYTPFLENGFKTNYQSSPTISPSKITICLNGDSIQTIIKNDSIAYYFLKLKNISVKYDDDNNDVIFIDGAQGLRQFSYIPLNVMFLKRNQSLYFILLAPKDFNKKLEPDFLLNLIIKSKNN